MAKKKNGGDFFSRVEAFEKKHDKTPAQRQARQNQYIRRQARTPVFRNGAERAVYNTAHKAYRTAARAIRKYSKAYEKSPEYKYRQRVMNRDDAVSRAGRKVIRKLYKNDFGRGVLGAAHGLASGVTFNVGDLAAQAEGYKDYDAYHRAHTKYHALTKEQEKKLKSSKAYKRGAVVGDLASYATGYAAAGKAIAKGATKVVGKKAAKSLVEHAAEHGAESLGKAAVKRAAVRGAEKAAVKAARKSSGIVGKAVSKKTTSEVGKEIVGKAVGKMVKADVKAETKAAVKSAGGKISRKELNKAVEKRVANMTGKEARKYSRRAAERVAKNVAKDAIGDLTVGAAMDVSHELKNGVKPIREGKDGKLYVNGRFVRDMGVNAATNIVTGGLMDTVPGMVKGVAKDVKGGKKKTVERIVRTSDGKYKIKKFKVAANEGEEAVTHAAEQARNAERSAKGARTKRINKFKNATKNAEEWGSMNRYSDWQKANRENIDRLESLRKKASGGDTKAAKEYDQLSETLSKSRDKAVYSSPRVEAKRKLAQSDAFKDLRNAEQKVSVKGTRENNPASYFREQDFVKHLKDNNVTIKDIRERAARNNTSVGEELTKEHQKFTAEKVRGEFEAKKMASESVSSEPKVAAAKVEHPKFSTSKVVDDNLSDEARGYLKEHNLTAEDVTKRSEGISDKEFAKEVSDSIGQRALNDAKGDMDAAEDALERYRKAGAADREAAKSVRAEDNARFVAEDSGEAKNAAETPEQAKARAERENDVTFERGLPQSNDELKKTIQNAESKEPANDVEREAKVLTEIDGKNTSIKEKVHEFLNRFTKNWINSSVGVERVAEKYNDRVLSGMWDAIRRRSARTNQLVNGDGFYRITKEGKTERVGDSLSQILLPEFDKGKEYYDELNEYLFRSHDVQRELYNKPVFTNPLDEKKEKIKLAKQFGEKPKPAKGRGLQFSDRVNEAFNDILKEKSENSQKIADELLKKHPEFKEVQDKIRQYVHNVNMLKVDSGVMTKEQLEVLEKRYPNYVPTYRAEYYLPKAGVTSRNGSIKASAGIVGAKGSSKDIAPLQLQLAAFTSRSVNASAYNDFAVRMLGDFDSKYIIKDIQPIDISKVVDDSELVEKAAEEVGKDGSKNNNPFSVKLSNIVDINGKDYTMTAIQGNNAYRFVIDKDVFDAVKALEQPIPDVKLLKGMNNTFRNLVTTLNPFFPVRNGARDFLDAAAYSQYGTGAFLKNYPKAWRLMISNSDIWKTYKNLSGVGNTLRSVTEDITAKGYKRYEGIGGRISWGARNLIDRVEVLNEIVEQGPRFTEFLTTLEKEGNSPDSIIKALYNANEITENFNRSGIMGKWLNANGATFLNAGIQDVARTAKLLKQGKVGKLLWSAAVFGIAPSLINEALCGDDPNYQRIRTQDKDVNFYIPVGDGAFLKIPKGRVTGTIASVPQRVVRELMGNTDKSETMLQGAGESAKNQVSFNNPLKSNLYAPINDSKIGNDKSQGETWYGTPVVSSALKDKPQSEQYDENTTELAKFLGEKLNKSPEKIDYILKQSTGVIGQTLPALPHVGSVAKTGGDSGIGAIGNAFKNLATSNFVTDTATNNKRSSDFYSRLDELKQKSKSNKATQYDKMVYSFMYKQSGNLGSYNDQISKVERNKSLSASEKLSKIRLIRRKQTKETEKVISMEKDYKKYYNQLKDKFSVSDFKSYSNPEQQMKSALNDAIERKVAIKHGADPVEYDFSKLSKTQREGWKSAKKSGVSKDTFMKYKVDSTGSGRTTISKAFAAIDAGAKNRKQAGALVTNGKGKISKETWENAKTLKKSGITSDNLKKYSKLTHGLKESAYAAKAYAAIKSGAKNYNQALAISGSNIYGTTWNSVVIAHDNGVSYNTVKRLYSDAVQKQMTKTASNGRPYRTKDLTVRWIENHYGNKPLSVKRTYYNMLKYKNWGAVY